MYFQYPLEALARRRSTLRQIDFAREARRLLADSDEVAFEPVDHGLAIFAAHEEALAAPRLLLEQAFGDFVEIRGPKVRRMPGSPPLEPVMHVRVAGRRTHEHALLRELRARGVRVLEECRRGPVLVVRGEAPLAALLGLPARIHAVGGAACACDIRLLRYDPVTEAG